MEVIGVVHDGEKIQNRVIGYVDSKYPSLKKIMLELPLGYEYLRENGWEASPFFSGIYEHYIPRGVEVICGDINRLELIGGISPEEILEILNRDNKDFKRMMDWGIIKGMFNGKLGRLRDEGLEKMICQENPEVSIVGARHAMHMKKKNPEIYFPFFTKEGVIRNLIDRKERRVADATYVVD